MSRGENLVWYASYGSNCERSRFMLYLQGGRRPGTHGEHRGARNPSPPIDSAPVEFPTQVAFAGKSKRWGGGVAFLEHQVRPNMPGALGRRYLITKEQFDDVAAQESHRPTAPVSIDQLDQGKVSAIGSGWYDGLLALEPVDGTPVVTFTSPHPPEATKAAAPSIDYLATIVTGLGQVHDIGFERIIDRLRLVAVIAATWTQRELLDIVEARVIRPPSPNGSNDS